MFIFGIIIVSLIFSIQPFLKKNIMEEFNLDEYTIYTSVISLLFFFIGSLFKGLQINDLKTKSLSKYGMLILTSLLTLTYSTVLNMLLKDFKVSDVMPFIRCGEMLWILIISGLINLNDLSISKISGVIVVILGIYINQKL
jgi:hypothetical protein